MYLFARGRVHELKKKSGAGVPSQYIRCQREEEALLTAAVCGLWPYTDWVMGGSSPGG